VAGLAVGMGGAELGNAVNQAALVATRRRAEAVTLADFTQAIERVVAGIEKKTRVLSPREREVVTCHDRHLVQIGGQASEVVILTTNQKATGSLLANSVKLAGEVSVVAAAAARREWTWR
jgi:ATP-dependent Zn protease